MSVSSVAPAYSGSGDGRRTAEPADRSVRAIFWRINGYRARLLVWTIPEWEKLETRPSDAQYHPSGVWCALRMD
jgi:hypothetical protein